MTIHRAYLHHFTTIAFTFHFIGHTATFAIFTSLRLFSIFRYIFDFSIITYHTYILLHYYIAILLPYLSFHLKFIACNFHSIRALSYFRYYKYLIIYSHSFRATIALSANTHSASGQRLLTSYFTMPHGPAFSMAFLFIILVGHFASRSHYTYRPPPPTFY